MVTDLNLMTNDKIQNQQINRNNTTLVRIDKGMKRLLKIKAAESGMTIKALLEGYLAELLAVDQKGKRI